MVAVSLHLQEPPEPTETEAAAVGVTVVVGMEVDETWGGNTRKSPHEGEIEELIKELINVHRPPLLFRTSLYILTLTNAW